MTARSKLRDLYEKPELIYNELLYSSYTFFFYKITLNGTYSYLYEFENCRLSHCEIEIVPLGLGLLSLKLKQV